MTSFLNQIPNLFVTPISSYNAVNKKQIYLTLVLRKAILCYTLFWVPIFLIFYKWFTHSILFVQYPKLIKTEFLKLRTIVIEVSLYSLWNETSSFYIYSDVDLVIESIFQNRLFNTTHYSTLSKMLIIENKNDIYTVSAVEINSRPDDAFRCFLFHPYHWISPNMIYSVES